MWERARERFRLLVLVYSRPRDVWLMALGCLSAVVAGIGYLAFDYLMWYTIGNAMGNTPDSIGHTLVDMGYFMTAMSFALLASLSLSGWLFRIAANNRTDRMRALLAAALLKRPIRWYDSQPESVHEAFLFFRDQVSGIYMGVGSGMQQFIFFVSICIGGFIASLFILPRLALVLLGTVPIIFIGMAAVVRSTVKAVDLDRLAFSCAARSAMKTLRHIKHVFSYQQEDEELSKFNRLLVGSSAVIVRTAILTGLGQMAAQGMAVIDMGIGLWYETSLLDNGSPISADGSNVVYVLTTMIYGAFALGYSTEGLTAAVGAIGLIERAEKQIFAAQVQEEAEAEIHVIEPFTKITFASSAFGSAPTSGELTHCIAANNLVAFVSPSGFDKSVISSTLMRFSSDDLMRGIRINSHDLSQISTAELRTILGYVCGKEPGIFNTTLRANLLVGLNPSRIPPDENIMDCLAHVGLGRFVACLPEGLQTDIKRSEYPPMTLAQERQMGLARALLRNPAVLILDGITDGLPPEDERIMHMVVEAVRSANYDSITIIVVTDRYVNMQRFDKIYVLSESGLVTEEGTHDELLGIGPNGVYFKLIREHDPERLPGGSYLPHTGPPVEIILPSLIPHVSDDISPTSRVSIRRETGIVHRPLQLVQNKTFSWRRIIGFSKEYLRIDLPVGVLSSMLCGVIPPIVIFLLSRVTEVFDQWNSVEDALWYIVTFLALGGGMGLTCLVREIAFGRMTGGTTRSIRLSAMEHILHQPVDIYESGNSAESVMSSLWSKCYSAGYLASVIINSVVECISWFLVAVVISLIASWKIASVSVSTTIIFTFGYYVFYTRLPQDPEIPESVDLIGDSISSIRVIKSVLGEKDIVELFDSALALENKPFLWNSYVLSLFESLPFSICPLLTSFGFWYSGTVYASTQDASLAAIIQATYAIGDAAELAMYVISWLPDFVRYENEALKVFDLLDNDSSFDRGERVLQGPIKSLKLNRLGFAYSFPLKSQVLHQISLEANLGESIAIVGPFKSGKSSVFNLIQRFYDPQYGTVLVNGVNIRDFTIHSLRKLQGYAPQQPVLFEGTIRENIMYGFPDATIEDFSRVAAICTLDFFEDWNMPIGAHLSASQVQRICLARVMIRDPSLLLLDEPFAMIDPAVAERIKRYLLASKATRITVTATANPACVEQSDRIYVIDGGKITQSGSHVDLRNDVNGIYLKMN